MVGAAPETVATLHRGSFHATAVAGSIAHGETPEEMKALAGRLLASEKDREEHRIALDDMVRRLKPLAEAEAVEAQPEPHVLTLARIQHLETEIRARVPEGSHVLEVLEALHPTPAVCGPPRTVERPGRSSKTVRTTPCSVWSMVGLLAPRGGKAPGSCALGTGEIGRAFMSWRQSCI